MELHHNLHVSVGLFALIPAVFAATCSTVLTASYPAPIVSNGWEAQLIAQGLTAPRSILFDSNGGLLVVQQDAGIVHLEFTDNGSTCLEVSKKTYLINSTAVSTEIVLFTEGRLLTCLVKPWDRALE